MTVDVSACGCRWERDPSFGDVIVEPCTQHDPRRSLAHGYDVEYIVRRNLDAELDQVVRGGRGRR